MSIVSFLTFIPWILILYMYKEPTIALLQQYVTLFYCWKGAFVGLLCICLLYLLVACVFLVLHGSFNLYQAHT
jgi:hypothetical protein